MVGGELFESAAVRVIRATGPMKERPSVMAGNAMPCRPSSVQIGAARPRKGKSCQ